MQNKYSFLSTVPYDVLMTNRGRIVQVYPETAHFFLKNVNRGCRGCKKRKVSRSILLCIMEVDSSTRDLTPLKGVLPQELLDSLKDTPGKK
jgi:hypothetical protein